MAWINVYSGKEELLITLKYLRKLIGILPESRWLTRSGKNSLFIKGGHLIKEGVENGIFIG